MACNWIGSACAVLLLVSCCVALPHSERVSANIPSPSLRKDGVLYEPRFGLPGQLQPAVRHVINLDLAPEQRWVEVCKLYQSLGPAITAYFTSQLPAPVVKILETIMADLDGYLGDYGKEMRGAAQGLGVDLGIIVGLNFAYELRKWGGGHPNITQYEPQACSAILAQNTSGALFHGRNMDWNLPNDIRNITFQCDFQKGGQTVFVGACYAGFVGILTGLKPNAFAIEVNERDLGGSPIEDALTAIVEGATSVTHLVRYIMETQTDYSSALSLLKSRWISAPVYYTITGASANQGAVLSRNRDFNRDLWTLPNTQGPAWYLFQTNYDHWLPDPVHDARRTYGEKHMDELGQNAAASAAGVYNVLTQWPVGNNFTAQTVIMSVGTGYFKAFIRYA